MPGFWQFPTVSMGLGPLSAIYLARFNRYLRARGIKDTSGQRVWAFPGDGEMDEPESLAGLSLAAREGLDNLTFVVNCNLQRLDGPVRGNGKIIQELESTFRGAGWNVIKVIWAREWDELLARDVDGVLVNKMNETLDGDYQRLSIADGAYIREHFFGPDPRLGAMVAHLSDDELTKLRRGGHDYRKLFAAYTAAVEHTGSPTVILAATVKGWTLGPGIEGRNVTHQAKKLTEAELKIFRDRLELPIPDDRLKEAPYYHPGADAPEMQYLFERRRHPGWLPARAAGPRRLPCRRLSRRSSTSCLAGPIGRPARPWPSAGSCGTWFAILASASESSPSSRTRRAPSEWTRSSRRSASIQRSASATTPVDKELLLQLPGKDGRSDPGRRDHRGRGDRLIHGSGHQPTRSTGSP